MNLTRDRAQSIGWVAVLIFALAVTLALTFKVNAVKSQVRLAERQIVSLKREKMLLETEFLTRANQQQLRALNDVEFGYQAPTSGQYLENERDLAALGKPRAAGAPDPIRVARADDVAAAGFPAMVSPLTGQAMAAEVKPQSKAAPAAARNLDAEGLDARLSRVSRSTGSPGG